MFEYLKLSQVRALAKANRHDTDLWLEECLLKDVTGELFVVYPEGTKVARRKEGGKIVFCLWGYTDTDVPRTVERLKSLPPGRKPQPRKLWRLSVNEQPHWTDTWAGCQREAKNLRAGGFKGRIEFRRVNY